MAGSSLPAGSFGASLAGGSGFWWTGRGAQCWGKSSKPSPDAGGGEPAGFASPFPGQAEVVDVPFRVAAVRSGWIEVDWDRSEVRALARQPDKFRLGRFPLMADKVVDLELEPFSPIGPRTRFAPGSSRGPMKP